MATCVRVVSYHGRDIWDAPTSPVPVVILDPYRSDVSKCEFVVTSGAEVANGLFSLSAADGAYLSAAIIGVWVAAYLIRSVIDVIKGSTEL